MSISNFETLLDECLARLYSGERIDDILQDQPEYTNRLRPLLEVAAQMSTLPAPHARPTAIRQGRQRMLEAVDEKTNAPCPAFWQQFIENLLSFFPSLRPVFGNALALIILAGLVAGLAWIFTSLDLESDPAGQQTPTSTMTPSEMIPTPSGTVLLTPTKTLLPTNSAIFTQTKTFTPSISPAPIFITLTPTPASTKKNVEDESPEIPTPTKTPVLSYPPPVTDTPLPPYPPPMTETPTPANTTGNGFKP
ncbi:MAG TPA: hypothetical protein VI451_03260 [Anaerolineales bacterium]|nr:hypothetical protein [Anaerolineales bacterium]